MEKNCDAKGLMGRMIINKTKMVLGHGGEKNFFL
jgi:hypothetical protein